MVGNEAHIYAGLGEEFGSYSKMGNQWRVLNTRVTRFDLCFKKTLLVAEWLMNGNGKRRDREVD